MLRSLTSTAHSNTVSDAHITLTLSLGKHSAIFFGVRVMLTVLRNKRNKQQMEYKSATFKVQFPQT